MSDAIQLEGVHNFRAVAPYRTEGGRMRPGMIYRSGALEQMTPEDERHLSATVSVRTILDLRHPDELKVAPANHPLRHLVEACSIFPEDNPNEAFIAELNGLYGTGITPGRYMHYLEVGGDRFARAFTLFARADAYPVLIHCSAGKDRTGVLLALIMDVLRVSHDDIAHEYGLSDQSIDHLIRYLRASGRHLQGSDEEIRARLSTPPDRMAGFLELFVKRFGTAEAFLAGKGVAPETFAAVRRNLVETA